MISESHFYLLTITDLSGVQASHCISEFGFTASKRL